MKNQQLQKKVTYKKYRYKGKYRPFTVFIIHGTSSAWRTLQSLVEGYQYKTLVLSQRFNALPLNDHLREKIYWECDCAIAILTPDDLLKNKKLHPRLNVIYELGLVHGLIDCEYGDRLEIEPVILLKEEKTEMPSDLQSLIYMPFKKGKIRTLDAFLKQTLDEIYEQLKDYYR